MQPPQTQLVIPQWLALPMPVRLYLKKVFNIPRSEGTNLVDGVVVSDGHTHPDLAHITIESMEAYLGLERVPDFQPDFHKLFGMVLDKVEREMNPAPAALSQSPVEELAQLIPDSEVTMTSPGSITVYPDDLHTGWDGIKDLPADNTTTEVTIAEEPKPKKTRAKKTK